MNLLAGGAAILGTVTVVSFGRATPLGIDRGQGSPDVQSQEVAAIPRIEDEIARLMAASRPGREHAWLEPLVGSWKMDVTSYTLPHATTHVTGTSQNRWILGGRFLLCEATTMGPSPVESMTVYGFDNRQNRFFAVSLDNLRTSYGQPWGTYDPIDRSLILSGKERDDVTGSVLVYRQLLKIEGPNRHSLQVFFDPPGGPPLKVLEATFTRRGDASSGR